MITRVLVSIVARVVLETGETRKAYSCCSLHREGLAGSDSSLVVDSLVSQLSKLGSFKSNDIKVKIGIEYVGNQHTTSTQVRSYAWLLCKRDAIPYERIQDLILGACDDNYAGDVTDPAFVPDDTDDLL